MRFLTALLLVAGLGMLVPATEVAAQGCSYCANCAGGDQHENLSNGFVGNYDDPHGCFAYSCLDMQYGGVHRNECYSGFARAELEDAAKDGLARSELRDLLAKYPESLQLDASGRYVQVVHCESGAVHAQLAIAERQATAKPEAVVLT